MSRSLDLILLYAPVWMFAEAAQTTDPLSGGAGWVGAGLLGLVLAWLMLKHIPEKDRQFEKLTTNFQVQINTIIENYNMERRESLDKFDGILSRLSDKHSADVKEVIGEIKSQFQILTKLVMDGGGSSGKRT